MRLFYRRFLKAEDGATTVDWVVITAMAMSIALAVFGGVKSGTAEPDQRRQQQHGQSVDHQYVLGRGDPVPIRAFGETKPQTRKVSRRIRNNGMILPKFREINGCKGRMPGGVRPLSRTERECHATDLRTGPHAGPWACRVRRLHGEGLHCAEPGAVGRANPECGTDTACLRRDPSGSLWRTPDQTGRPHGQMAGRGRPRGSVQPSRGSFPRK